MQCGMMSGSSECSSLCVVVDGSPTEQGVDHRQVQRELGEVSVYLQKPVVLSPTSAQVSWTVSKTDNSNLEKQYATLYCATYFTISWNRSIPTSISLLLCSVIGQVAHQSQYVQGYRLLYRSTGSVWLVQDVKAGPELSTVLSDLRTDTEYEVKVLPYFNELQGLDSPLVLLRTPKEGKTHSGMQERPSLK